MANYYATARTSYAKMIDDDAFKEWAGNIHDCTVITDSSDEYGTLYGLMFDGGDESGIPCFVYDEESGEDTDFDIYDEIQGHLADGWAITFIEVGAEKYRYVSGFVAVVTNKEIESYTLDRWVDETMNGLGDPKHTRPEY